MIPTPIPNRDSKSKSKSSQKSPIDIILLSGGSGSRVGADRPKQFLPLAGRPLLAHSATTLANWPERGRLVVAAHPDHIEETRQIIAPLAADAIVVAGGASRHSSTLAAIEPLLPLPTGGAILVHDAARPFLERAELDRLAAAHEQMERGEAPPLASLAAALTDTLIQGSKNSLACETSQRLDRSTIYAIKTPQLISGRVLERLLALPEEESFTDLLTWGEAAGLKGLLVRASSWNWKLTGPDDLPLFSLLAEQFFSGSSS